MIEGIKVDVEGLTHSKVNLQLPYISLNVNDTTPLVLTSMEKGGMSVIGEYKGSKRVISSISQSAYNIDKLIRTHGSIDWVDENGTRKISSIREYLEVMSGWML